MSLIRLVAAETSCWRTVFCVVFWGRHQVSVCLSFLGFGRNGLVWDLWEGGRGYELGFWQA